MAADIFFSRRRAVFLSPHPDDVVWSCGGLVAHAIAAGLQTRVITVFDQAQEHDPEKWTPAFGKIILPNKSIERDSHSKKRRHALGGPEFDPGAEPSGIAQASRLVRQAEDRAALHRLGAARKSLSLADAVLRRARDGKPLYPNGLALRRARIDPHDPALPRLVGALREALHGADVVVVPLARGTHVDHAITRRAAEITAPEAADLLYYPEFPYPLAEPDFAARRLDQPVDLALWLEAAMCYESQIAALFGSTERFRAALLTRATELGEREAQPGNSVFLSCNSAR